VDLFNDSPYVFLIPANANTKEGIISFSSTEEGEANLSEFLHQVEAKLLEAGLWVFRCDLI
jgi:hypothetical protein